MDAGRSGPPRAVLLLWVGKCEEHSPTCEGEARLHNQDVADRCRRLST